MANLRLLLSDRRMLIVFMLGFSGGLPLLLTGSTLQAWCKEAGMDLTNLGLLALVGLPYTLKFLWSPLLDWVVPKRMGRRRGWLLGSQIGLMIALAALAVWGPSSGYQTMAVIALVIAFLSATQDIAIDAYQLELLPPESYGLGNQLYVLGYRVAMLLAGGGTLILADHVSWSTVYILMAATMGIGIVTTLLAPEPEIKGGAPKSLADAVLLPLKDFFAPEGKPSMRAIYLLGFFLLYQIGYNMASAMTTPFYMDLGYTKTQIGSVVKVFGLWATILGGLLGGVAVISLGVRKCLWIFGVGQGIAVLGFAWLAVVGPGLAEPSIAALAATISAENFAAGLGMAAYMTFMGAAVNKRFSATQFALLTSFMGMTRVFGSAPTGWMVTQVGYAKFFVLCALASIPALAILARLQRNEAKAARADVMHDAPEAAPSYVRAAGARAPLVTAYEEKGEVPRERDR